MRHHNFAETPFPRFQGVIFCLACSLSFAKR
nr:MAG TPA: hypothetical protein [Caudoviricetes sp.]